MKIRSALLGCPPPHAEHPLDVSARAVWYERAAEVCGVSVEAVRREHEAMHTERALWAAERAMELHAVQRRAEELARAAGWQGSLQALLVCVLDCALERQRRRRNDVAPERSGAGVLDTRETRLGSTSGDVVRRQCRPETSESPADRRPLAARPRTASAHVGARRAS